VLIAKHAFAYNIQKVGKPLKTKNIFFKGIVSRDWGGLLMVLLDRFIKSRIAPDQGYF
jgi:hypothetical protein